MKRVKLNQRGAMDIFALMFFVATFFLIVSLSFGLWAYLSRQDFKNNSDEKAAAAVQVALADQEVELNAEFEERAKSPYEEYVGPVNFGTVKIVYPRTWSAYVSEDPVSNSSIPIDGYLNPVFVPGIDTLSSYALRFQVVNLSMDIVLEEYNGQIESGVAAASAYRPKNVITEGSGFRIDGEHIPEKQGSVILLPIRDKTLKIWVESQDFVDDLDSIILENLTYVP